MTSDEGSERVCGAGASSPALDGTIALLHLVVGCGKRPRWFNLDSIRIKDLCVLVSGLLTNVQDETLDRWCGWSTWEGRLGKVSRAKALVLFGQRPDHSAGVPHKPHSMALEHHKYGSNRLC